MRLALAALLVSSSLVRADDAPTPDERKAIDVVVRIGGKTEIDPKLAREARVVARVEMLDASRCTEKGFAALKELPNLRKLVLGKSNLKLASANAIGQCLELRHL